MHAVLFAKLISWPAWMQLLHPLATIIAKTKLLVLPVYPAAWPQAKKQPFIQVVFKSYKALDSVYLDKPDEPRSTALDPDLLTAEISLLLDYLKRILTSHPPVISARLRDLQRRSFSLFPDR